jgi:hypothetical protein
VRQRHIFGTVFTLESIVAGCVFLVIVGVLARVLVRLRAVGAHQRPRRRGPPALLVAAVLFWLPVAAGTRHRLDDLGRCLYLFLATPLLDLPAVAVVAAGRSAQGLAVIVGMLPLGVAAAAVTWSVTWSWVNREERQARGTALPMPGGDPLAR